MALIYINRMNTTRNLPLTKGNWQAVWFISVLLANKVYDDKCKSLKWFVKNCPLFNLDQLRELELYALTVLDFCLEVKVSLYTQYYFELRQLFAEVGVPYFVQNENPSDYVVKRVEARSKLAQKNFTCSEVTDQEK